MRTELAANETWVGICDAAEIIPNTGVAALVEGRHVAVFRVTAADGSDQFFAIDNVDPRSGASVLSRGLIGSLGDRIVVASPLYKNHFDLRNGDCLEAMEQSVRAYKVQVDGGQVMVSLG